MSGGLALFPFLFVPCEDYESPTAEDAAAALDVFYEPERGETVELHAFALDDACTFLYGEKIAGMGHKFEMAYERFGTEPGVPCPDSRVTP